VQLQDVTSLNSDLVFQAGCTNISMAPMEHQPSRMWVC